MTPTDDHRTDLPVGTPGGTTLVIGAGITGLTAAHVLATAGRRVVVVDADDRVGGKIRTEPFAGHDLDAAADAFLARVPEAVELCHELGLADQLVTPASRRAYLLMGGALHRFPDGLVLGVPTDLDALRDADLLSPASVDRVAADLTMGGEPLDDDVSVGALVRARIGDDAFELLVEPLLSGVNAGNADALSVQAGAPQFAAAVREQPSLLAGLREQRAATTDPDAPVFYALRGGSSTLIDALADSVSDHGGSMRLGTAVTRIARGEATTEPGDDRARWRVELGDGSGIEADAVILAVPTFVASRLLAEIAPQPAAQLAEVEYASVAMIAFAFPRQAVADPLDGTGFLVSRREGLLMTACSWASSKWAHLDDGNQVLLRVSAGRSGDEQALELDDTDLAAQLVDELRPILGITRTAHRHPGHPLDRCPPPVPTRPPPAGLRLAGNARCRRPGDRAGRRGLRRAGDPRVHPAGASSCRPGAGRRLNQAIP